jgi:uncharacterized protein (TIGR00297 family)
LLNVTALNLLLTTLIVLLAAFAGRAKLLTVGGILAATVVGLASLLGGGPTAVLLLFVFFTTSNALGRFRKKAKQLLGFEKGGTRDQWQVLANGAPALIGLLIGFLVNGRNSGVHLPLTLFAAALAESNADTWATEIGAALGKKPRSIINGKLIAPGQSGGISIPGTLASAFGAILIAGCYALFVHENGIWLASAVISISGFCGSLVDSLLGAVVQAQFIDRSGKIVETPMESSIPAQGLFWFRNDAVNFAAGMASVAFACLAMWLK